MSPDLTQLINAGAIFYVSHSGGKDSQYMYAYIMDIIPIEQIVVVHSDLGKIEWEGVQDHIRANIDHELNVVRANKTFFDMVRRRAATRPDVPSFPSSAHRQCTSDLKRSPIQKFIRNDMKARGTLLAVNCMGLRAQESSAISKRPQWQLNKMLSAAGRTVYDWNPILHVTEREVFAGIERAGQQPFWAYAAGNKRLSCVFCIMGCESDLKNGKKHNPDLYQEYIELEQETGWTLFATQSLSERTSQPQAQLI